MSKNKEFVEYLDSLREKIQFIQEENARLEIILRRVKMVNDESRVAVDIKEKVSIIEEALSNTVSATDMSQIVRLRKHLNYVSKLKLCIKIYTHINERLSEDIKVTKRELVQSTEKLGGVSKLTSEQLQQLEQQAKRYETEVLKFEKRYPWLKDPSFNLPDITKEVQKLNGLKETKEKLLKKINVYKGLKPDISEATQQLAQLKEETRKIDTLLTDNL